MSSAQTPPSRRALSECFGPTLGGLRAVRIPADASEGDLFARAYLTPGNPRSINIGVYNLTAANRADYLAQHRMLGRDGETREGNGVSRTGGTSAGRPTEVVWMELSSGRGHEDSYTILLTDSRLLRLSVLPDAQRGDAARIFGELDRVCLTTARVR